MLVGLRFGGCLCWVGIVGVGCLPTDLLRIGDCWFGTLLLRFSGFDYCAWNCWLLYWLGAV